MKRNIRSRSESTVRRGAAMSAAVLASVIMAGSASAYDIPSGSYTVVGGSPLHQNTINVGTTGSAQLVVTNSGRVSGNFGLLPTRINLGYQGSGLEVSYNGFVSGNVVGGNGLTNYVSVHDGGAIGGLFGGNVTLDKGQVHLYTKGTIYGGVTVNQGSVLLEGTSAVYGGIRVTSGSIGVDTGSVAMGVIHNGQGNITLSNSSSFINARVTADNGDIRITDSSVRSILFRSSLNVGTGQVYLENSSVNADIKVTSATVGHSNVAVDVNTGTKLTGKITVGTGDVNIRDHGTEVTGDVKITTGDLNVTNHSRLTGDVNITTGDVNVDGRSRLRGSVDIVDGDVNVTNRSFISGSSFDYISISGTGGVTVGSRSGISTGGISLYNGDLGVSGRSRVNVDDDIFIRTGDITVEGNSSIRTGEDIVLLKGNINADHSYVRAGDDIVIRTGSISATNGSYVRASDDIRITRGDIVATDSRVRAGDDISIQRGSISATNSSIRAGDDISIQRGGISATDSSIRAGDDISIQRGGISATNSSIRAGDDIFLRSGSIYAEDHSSVRAGDDIVLLNGGVTITGRSRLSAGDNLYVRRGDVEISYNSRGYIDRNLTIGTGNLYVTGTSRLSVGRNLNVDKGDIAATQRGHIHVGRNVSVDEGNIILLDSHLEAGRDGWGGVRVGNGDVFLNNSLLEGDWFYSHEGDVSLYNNSTLSGRTTINDGLLYIDETSAVVGNTRINADAGAWVEGTIYGNVRLRGGTGDFDGGALFGTNVTITGDLANNGIVSPGVDFGTVGKVRVGEDFYQAPTGTYYADIVSRKSYDQILVGGSAVINGGDLYVNRNGYKPYREDTFNLIEAVDGVDVLNKYKVHSNFAKNTMLEANVRYRDNAVQLHIHQRKFEKEGETGNQRSVGRALDFAANRDQLDPLFDHLNYTDRSNVPRLLQLLSPESLTTIYNVGFANAQIQNINIERRLDDVRNGSCGFSANGLALSNNRGTINFDGVPVINDQDGLSLAGFDGKAIVDKNVVAPIVTKTSPWGFFVTGSGEWGDIKSTRDAHGGDFSSGGVTIGADYRVNDNLVVGLFGGYVHNKTDFDLGGDVKTNGGRGGLYGSFFRDGFYVNALASGGYNNYKINRKTIGGTARGKTDGGQFDALLGGGYDFSLCDFTLGPVGSVQYSYVGFKGFREHGSDADLDVRRNNQDSLRTLLGAKATTAWNVCGMVLRPEVRAQWKHEYLNSTGTIDSSFTGSGALFTVHGPKIGRNSLLIDAGASLDLNESIAIYAYYTGEVARTNYHSNSVNGGFRLSF